MEHQSTELSDLGWNDWFAQRSPCGLTETVARVAAVDRDLLLLLGEGGAFRARLSGSLLHRSHPSPELPCVGDWVCVKKHPGDAFGLVYSHLERKTTLRRRSAGNAIEYQMIAANVDTVIIVQSCHFDFNLKRLERYLVMVQEGGAAPCILLTKTDLIGADELQSLIEEIRSTGLTAPIFTLSNITGEGVDDFRRQLQPRKTYCFAGSSGVGKSTLINHLVGHESQATRAVSGTGEGRHTTVRRELILLAGGALVIDNPGMREFGTLDAEDGIADSFSDILALAERCRFRDCTHTNEPHCAVIAALKSGELNPAHYENFIKLRAESEFYGMSYAEKRKKDRNFGKFVKSVKKDRQEW